MATPLDIGLLKNVSIIFPFLLVITLAYAVLSMTKIFGDPDKSRGLNAFVAFVLAVMTLFSSVAVKTINLMAPWFVLLFIFSIFLLIAYKTFGVDDKKILDVVTGKRFGGTVFYWILALALIIGLGSLSTVISQEKGFKTLSDENANRTVVPDAEEVGFFQTIFPPKVLGMVLLLLIAVFTVKNLASYED